VPLVLWSWQPVLSQCSLLAGTVQVLEPIEPPFPEGFSRALLQLMAISQFTRVERNFPVP
jgi:hypothetical protein